MNPDAMILSPLHVLMLLQIQSYLSYHSCTFFVNNSLSAGDKSDFFIVRYVLTADSPSVFYSFFLLYMFIYLISLSVIPVIVFKVAKDFYSYLCVRIKSTFNLCKLLTSFLNLSLSKYSRLNDSYESSITWCLIIRASMNLKTDTSLPQTCSTPSKLYPFISIYG